VISGIVDGDEGRGLSDGILECLHGLLMFFMPDKWHAFACEVHKRVSNTGVVLDLEAYVPGKAKKSMDIGEGLAVRPVMNLGNLGVVGDVAVVVALMIQNDDL
jgi:hypothetical protein